MTKPPHSPQAEWSVVGQMLSKPKAIIEVIGSGLEAEDFFQPDCRLVFEAASRTYFADERVDAVTIGDMLRSPLSRTWGVDEGEVPGKLWEQAAARAGADSVMDHTKLVKRHSDLRKLLALVTQVEQAIELGDVTPEVLGDMLGTEASKIVTGSKIRSEILTMKQVGEEYVEYLARLKAAQEQGVELGAYFGLKFIDQWTRGLLPGEFMIVAGPPGVGKSAVSWSLIEAFAKRQELKPPGRRVEAMVFSMEMGLVGSLTRTAQSNTGLDGERLREGKITDDEFRSVQRAFKRMETLPLNWNFASNFKMSQMRAMVVEAIRKYNVGVVLLDHFRTLDPDRRINNANQEDEEKARFLREQIARDLNVVVVCLAHTIKIGRDSMDGRPTLNDLRGSGQVAAHTDVTSFVYRPWMHATDNEKLIGSVKENEAEIIYGKNRNGRLGAAEFVFEPSTMEVRDMGWAT